MSGHKPKVSKPIALRQYLTDHSRYLVVIIKYLTLHALLVPSSNATYTDHSRYLVEIIKYLTLHALLVPSSNIIYTDHSRFLSLRY